MGKTRATMVILALAAVFVLGGSAALATMPGGALPLDGFWGHPVPAGENSRQALPTAAPPASSGQVSPDLPSSAPAVGGVSEALSVAVASKANELGTVPILAYHIIGGSDGRWSRSTNSFRQDLERLYKAGFRSVSLSSFIDNNFNIPAGTSPIVLTFDDSSPGQFTFIKSGDELKLDPNCAVAILEEFVREHPDFGLNATFFVLPAADPPHDLFGQKEYQKLKLEYLVQRGMEIGNHTYWHQNLSGQPDEVVVRQIGQATKVITDMVPGYKIRAFALPLDQWPPNRALVVSGEWQGTAYKHDAILLAGSYPAPAPARTDFNPLALPRVQVLDETLDHWLGLLDSNADMRYVSDGDPSTVAFPKRLSDKLNPKAVGDKKVVAY